MAGEWLYGRRPVLEALRAGRRPARRLLIGNFVKEDERLNALREAARQRNLRVEIVDRAQLDSRTKGANHQGVALDAAEYPYVDLDVCMQHAGASGQEPFFLLLDLLQDVQNVGTLLRAAEAVGVHGVILQERRAASITPAVVSASSGAVEHLNIAQVTNIVQTMEILKERDVWIAGLDQGEDAQRIDQANLRGALGLVVGSEGKGLRRLARERCDFIIRLPMQGRIESLNASTAGSVALYAAWQARDFATNLHGG